jgi:hypothetical protein
MKNGTVSRRCHIRNLLLWMNCEFGRRPGNAERTNLTAWFFSEADEITCEDDVRASTESVPYLASSAAKPPLLAVGKTGLLARGRD